jgi:two-component system sensor histidine kinase KdpD
MASTEQRPDPDALLAKVQRQEAKRSRGRLKIFFGAAAGVGKTFSMLLAAREQRDEGRYVVVGIVETHGRAETAALLAGMEMLPSVEIAHRGTVLRELDLDAALTRRPGLVLVDELAHSNAPGTRHPKRWQDIEELLNAGIDVYTTLNVQHLESLNDIVGGITGIRVWETIPDTFFEQADEVELVDLPPDELLERLHEGKVYFPKQAQQALANFFRKGNLIALRELALRRTAERVDAQMQEYREDVGIRDVWQVAERVLVCLGPGPADERLVRAGRRLAAALRAEWIVVYVETPRLQRLPPARRDAILETLRLAEQLGAETAALSGPSTGEEIIGHAKRRNVTKVVMGSPSRAGWRRWLLGSVVDEVARGARDLDVILVGGEDDLVTASGGDAYLQHSRRYLGLAEVLGTARARLRGYASGLLVTAACTLAAWAMHGVFDLSNIIMVYLLGVLLVATRFGRGASVLTSVLSVAAFDFFFVPPHLTFAVADAQYLITFAVMLTVAMVISHLTADMRSQAKIAGFRERRAAALYEMTRELAVSRSESEIVRSAVRHLATEFEGPNVILFPDAHGMIGYPRVPPLAYSLTHADLGVAQWVLGHSETAGRGTDTLAGATATYFPVHGSTGTIGVLAIEPASLRRILVPEQQRLLLTFLSQIAQAIERVRLADVAKISEIRIETESLRSTLLSAISHDLRTPLAAIVGSASSLAEDAGRLNADERRELARTIYDEAQRMAALTNSILDMARLDAGAVTLNRQWCPVEEMVGSVLTRLRPRLTGRAVRVALAPELPMVFVDAAMMEQAMVNLLENIVKYTPVGSPADISARTSEERHSLELTVADRGPGIPEDEAERLFEKFYRARQAREQAQSGVGLGLTICRAIVETHGGHIRAGNRDGGGAEFTISLPIEQAPTVEAEEALLGAP